jgi:hypothetical protein
MTSGLPDTRTEAPDTPRPRGLLDPYTDLGTPPRKEPKPPKHLRQKIITRQNEEAEDVEQEEAAEDMTKVESRSNSYVPDTPLRMSPRLSRSTRKTYGKPYSKTAYGQTKTARAALEIWGGIQAGGNKAQWIEWRHQHQRD